MDPKRPNGPAGRTRAKRRARAVPGSSAPAERSVERRAPGSDSRNREDPRIPEGLAADRTARPPTNQRRALSHVGGAIDLVGPEGRERRAIESALDVDSDEDAVRAHIHGFHAYPARMHPITASRLVRELTRPGNVVLDPFCGSGTVLVEARIADRRALGVDVNPLALELCWLKTMALGPGEAAAMVDAADAACSYADERRVDKAGPLRRYPPLQRAQFLPHVLLELDSLSHFVANMSRSAAQRRLRLVLSATLTKLSLRESDTQSGATRKRVAPGFAIRLFKMKTVELVERLGEFAELLPRAPRAVRSFLDDARRLEPIRNGVADLILSSPPYPGVYDYLSHHELRLDWLGLDRRHFAKTEIGSRRQLSALGGHAAEGAWARDLGAALGQMRRALAPNGRVALLLADSVAADRAVYADDLMAHLAPRAGLRLLAVGSQPRPHFHGKTRNAFNLRQRREHLFVLGADA